MRWKQWESIEVIGGKEAIGKKAMNRGLVKTTPTSYQGWSYTSLIKDYNANPRMRK
jgi:uncharacterized protein